MNLRIPEKKGSRGHEQGRRVKGQGGRRKKEEGRRKEEGGRRKEDIRINRLPLPKTSRTHHFHPIILCHFIIQ